MEQLEKNLTTIHIGNTPVRKCSTLSALFNTNIFIKEEFHNPGMSAKDRPALYMVQDAIANNKIQPGGTFVEASSGNTGLGITLIAKSLGYRSKIFVSKSCSDEKIDALQSAGAEIEICENSNGLHDFNSTQFRAQSYAATNDNAYFTNQYYNTQNIRAHYKSTGPELWEQTQGKITHFIAGIGTGGTISGVGRFLKAQNKHIKIWGVEPRGSVLRHFLKSGSMPDCLQPFEPIEGIGRNFIPGSLDVEVIDDIFQVESDDAKQAARRYAAETGILIGFSSAAIVACLSKYMEEMRIGRHDHVVLFFPDHGSRYISKLYAAEGQAIHYPQHIL